MRASSASLYFLLAAFAPVNHAITLSQFQQVNGFSQACINAYNTPLAGCQASDFESGSCSLNCITFLEALTKVINSECGGTSAYPNTLIGSFFNDAGTSALCPNVLGVSTGSTSQSADVTYTSTVVAEASPSTSDPTTTTSSIESTSSSTSTTSSSSSVDTSSSTLQVAVTTSTTTAPSSTASAAATTTEIAIAKTTVEPSISSSSSSSSSSTHSSTQTSHTKTSSSSTSSTSTPTPADGNGGGGSPLDVGGSNVSCRNAGVSAWTFTLLAVSACLLSLI